MAINKKDYTTYGSFKLWTIENFPFIEADFDAITNYQLYSKIVEQMRKLCENQNLLQQSQNEVIIAFNELEKYVENYFENLDVQEEINNKLDEMADSGELAEIVAQFLQLTNLFAFDTVSDMASSENITNGMICYTAGQTTYNDGKGAFYKIRTITLSDVIDGINIISITASENLVAELITNFDEKEIVFNTLSDMKEDTTLKNGQKVKTLGYSTLKDGGNASYLIRTKTEADTVDDGSIVSLANDDLIAELIIEDYITPEMFGAVGDGETDDTVAFENAIALLTKIKGVSGKTYKIDHISTDINTPVDIYGCNFITDPQESETDVKMLFRTYNPNVKFENCTFTSSFEYLPVINIINGTNTGLASNVMAIRSEAGAEVINCTFNEVYGIDTRGKLTVINCKFNEVEMGIFSNAPTDTINIDNCQFTMNKKVNSEYYHAMYVQSAKNFIANNLVIKEVNTGSCGDHLHFKLPNSSDLTVPSAIITNVIIDGDLSFDYISQNNQANLIIDNLTYNGSTNGGFQTGQAGNITINNSKINCAGNTLFNCYNNIVVNNSVINCSAITTKLATRCNLEMHGTTIKSTGTLNMERDVNTGLVSNFFDCIFDVGTISSLNCSGNSNINNICNCVYYIGTGNINLAGRGYTYAIVRHASNPSSLNTIADHNSYTILVYQSNTYFKKFDAYV